MPSIESSTGKTKHADSCCISRPAFISVGEFGINFRLTIISRNRSLDSSYRASASSPTELASLKRYSPSAMFAATRRNMSMGSSMASPASFFFRYRFLRTAIAFSESSSASSGFNLLRPFSISDILPVAYLPFPAPGTSDPEAPPSRTNSERNWSTSVYWR